MNTFRFNFTFSKNRISNSSNFRIMCYISRARCVLLIFVLIWIWLYVSLDWWANRPMKKRMKDIFEIREEELNTRIENIRIGILESFKEKYEYGNGSRFYKYDEILTTQEYKNLSKEYNVCLATHCTIDRINYLFMLHKYWTGPISLSFMPKNHYEFTYIGALVNYLKKCDVNLYSKLTISMISTRRYNDEMIVVPGWRDEFPILRSYDSNNCKQIEDMLNLNRSNDNYSFFREQNKEESTSSNTHEDSDDYYDSYYNNYEQDDAKKFDDDTNLRIGAFVYLQNHLRNMASKNCMTKYHLVLDIDVMPSYGLARKLNEFLEKTKECKNCVYVLPTYEIQIGYPLPRNKKSLIRMINQKNAAPYHNAVFKKGQQATDFSRWEKLHDTFRKNIYAAYEIDDYELYYEPFYVSLRTVPKFNEDLKGYGFTRSSQAFEMFMKGYKFLVLSPGFTCHPGLIRYRVWSKQRVKQQKKNKIIFDRFMQQIIQSSIS